ncbi:MAG: hypothetical protein COZ06_17530 [Armatimonadetes bacterium CG_4_10_14_3_um_filter_66_18]|nr:hypothetical protein [Armatimonadota bacterium]OIO91780.1 MAG: hypothetical protein AUJ96_33310 [Armatimonadetes bacterium CG2_30_66_41]PIU95137.1 MAG: hypothetical protein COS65_03900 [Armatimonadetes bacterium CG06_land_8_20_14_3_00_66_21]PIX38478.1 MAG: hypothetical protein COZ57_30445 [Armatimonadetes bacterium CG_4_8_14_3_um_filter_66_20]PIY47820.1 MAG: hypothetical protein COZ06_17530 [Armatimonadetes bacterium CG_4_10_14_3_um_filter_66_18]PIZ44325.1 MAG: hypothetical protein COY42_14
MLTSPKPPSCVVVLLLCVSSLAAETPRTIAVFDEPLFPVFAGAQGLMPDDVRAALTEAGLAATLVDAATVADPARFNAQAFPVLVHLYGNTFPLVAIEALRKFRAAGGSVVAFGVPFCHACVEKGVAGWSTTGEEVDLVTRTLDGRNGTPGVLIRRTGTADRIWTGMWSPKVRAEPGTRWRVSAWVRGRGERGEADRLYVRFWDRTGKFLGQQGPGFPTDANDWAEISEEVTTPDATRAIDVCLAVFRPGEVVCDDLALVETAQPGRNRLADSGFDHLPAQQWHDTGHVSDYLGHDGLGMGGFRIVESNGQFRYAPPRGDPVGLDGVVFPPVAPGNQAVLDETSLPAQDRVFPLLATLGADGDPGGYSVGLIEHHCDQFRGAVDMWAGYPAPPSRQALQVVLTACATLLEKKALLSAAAAEVVRRYARSLPEETDRIYPLVPARPRDSVLPKSPPPGNKLVVASLMGLSWEEQILLRALQGLVNRREPTVYFDDAWTEQVAEGRERELVDDPFDLLDRYREAAAGAVLYDPDFPPGINVAVSMAGARDLLPCTAELAERFGIPVKEDLRGRWTTLADAYAWASEHVLPECTTDVVCHIKQGEPLSPTAAEMSASMVDYLVVHRVFSFHLNRAYSRRERQVVEALLAKYPAQTPVIGYFGPEPGGAPNLTNEWDCVDITSRLGKPFIFTVNGNLSVHSGFPSLHGRQTRREPPRYDPSKVYVAFYLSDGDSPTTYYNTACRWNDAARGRVPIGWSFPVAALDVCPLVAQRYYGEATPLDEFVMACSGLGYCYPQVYGSRIEGGDALLGGFFADTARGVERAGRSVVHVHQQGGTTDATLRRYATEIPGLRAVFADYGRTRTDYATSHFTAGDVPVLHCLTTGGNRDSTDEKAADEMLAQILEVTPKEHPAFIVAFGIYWFMGPDEVESVIKRLPSNYVAVRPSELAELYRQWQDTAP